VQELLGKIAIVTGAASGIGLAICEALVNEGMSVAMVDVNPESVASAERFGDKAIGIAVDVGNPQLVERAAQDTVDHFGALHVAVNNAGVAGFGTCWQLTVEEWRTVLDVNLWGVINGIRSFVPRIIDSGSEGHVVNVASMAALVPIANMGPYTASKHAVLGISDVLRAELETAGVNVGVSVVMPGLVRTGMSPAGVEPSQAAANVVDGIRGNRDYVYTDDVFADDAKKRIDRLLQAREYVIS
jgi:NAD(P)-dependent dehydrogenase (short-subunit alcohol dehydrogenase family)